MMTESEAKTKWCPYSNNNIKALMVYLSSTASRTEKEQAAIKAKGGDNCVASKCMAWRWVEDYKERRGFCGLAGKP